MYYLGLLALFLFILGFGFSALVEKYKLTAFTAFPLWFLKKTLALINPERPFLIIFLFIFLFNSLALCLYMLSGLLVFFPVLIAFLTGTNIGITVLFPIPEEVGRTIYRPNREVVVGPLFFLLTALVPLLELFAFCFAIALGLQMASAMFIDFRWANAVDLALPRLVLYLQVCLPSLFVAALAETRLIKELAQSTGEQSR